MVTLGPVHPNTVGGVHPYLMAISFPFRVDPHSGGVVTVPESSTQHINETIAVHVMVHPGAVSYTHLTLPTNREV